MLRLKAIGVRFALDDFGTGYYELQYLRRFPFDKLKINSSFVRSIETAPDAASIVHAVVSLGRGLGMKVTAEGVETAEQHLFLRAGRRALDAGLPLRPRPGPEPTEDDAAHGCAAASTITASSTRSGNRTGELSGRSPKQRSEVARWALPETTRSVVMDFGQPQTRGSWNNDCTDEWRRRWPRKRSHW